MGSSGEPNGQQPVYDFEPAGWIDLTDACHHYEGKHEVPWDIQKYFSQRYSIFSYYDDGICMTDDAWFGVTPEPIANKIAEEMKSSPKKTKILIDLFCGAGGNTIAFALTERWDRIISIERDTATLACAQNNASVYGIDDGYITWVHGDSFAFLKTLFSNPVALHPDLQVDLDATILFASPPWGGPGYSTDEVFNLNNMQPYSIADLHEAYKPLDHVLFLPRTSDLRQLAKLAPENKKIDIVQMCMEGASKALVAYVPGRGMAKA
ncbi:RNA cap guanine-N2 methyltransferase [Akanthomyces lecanii RCEF 1005]|uniref:Trimethylguanosine synthase n=1 Tax=Akanthomyces lecanii RCEF 1005 TaxID=1081108 RepID=A0A168IVY9_CORDF|nr:RNA cap guanine-N2 methyltransferase [Akanthomyces lecanii RCEF 1005]